MSAVRKPTDEQIHILDQIRNPKGNLMIRALAGTGKTTMLKMGEKVIKKRPVVYLVFNKRNKEEAERERKEAFKKERPKEDCFQSDVEIMTFNSLGHRAWGVGRRLKVDGSKTFTILKALIEDHAEREALQMIFGDIVRAVDLAKNLGYIPEGKFPHAHRLTTQEAFHAALEERPDPLFAETVDIVLFLSIKAAYDGWIDFNDQIYMPTLFGSPFPRYLSVLADEIQDLNPVNHEMLRRLNPNWFCGVGDDWQSIYAFRGAVRGGMAKIAESFSCQEAGLSISFRCPRAIVENARWRAPQFRWIKEGGHVERLHELRASDMPEECTILCRNNAPLFALAFRLLKSGRSVSVAGSEIGPRVIRTMQKIGDERDDSESLIAKINAWYEVKAAKSNAPKTLEDMRDCMVIFATFGKDLAHAVAYAEHLFSQQGTIKLSTGHKAKGMEWDNVFFLDPWLLDSSDQDLNLKYVIQTRAKQNLFEIDSENIRW